MMLGFKDADTMRRTLDGSIRRYTYSTALTTCGALASIQAPISIESTTDFVCLKVTGVCLHDAGIQINRRVDFTLVQQPRIEVIDSASMATLFDRPDVNWTNIWGSSLFPFYLPQPHVFRARSTITVVFTNVSAVAMRMQISFHGYKQKGQ